MTSYQLSERVNAQSILFWAIAVPIYRSAVAIDKSRRAIRSALPHLLFALIILAKALGLVAIVAGGAFLALVFWLVLIKIAVGAAVIALFAWVTYPRPARSK